MSFGIQKLNGLPNPPVRPPAEVNTFLLAQKVLENAILKEARICFLCMLPIIRILNYLQGKA